ncbi:transcriptional regulator [Opitutaceae bacterium TAV1]|nr:transcriptional regulator [Opitutaceae bacterium TAV1]
MPSASSPSTSGNRLPTLRDVAVAAGVSRSATARVLLGTGGEHVRVSEETQARIRAAAARLGYAPNRLAQQLRGASSRTLGVIVGSENVRVMAERVFALEQAAATRGYRLLVGRVPGPQIAKTGKIADDDPLAGYVADFAGRGVESVLCLFDLAPGRDAWARAAFGRFRKVVFHGRAAWRGGLAVKTDTAAAIRTAVDHVIARGKKRPALALWNAARDELMEVRRTAFAEALAAHGLPAAAVRVWDAGSESVTPDPATMDRGVEALVGTGRADAILASNDIWAVRFIQTLKAKGLRVPEDVAVIGHDDLDIGSVIEPPLTTINPNHEAYAEAALALLLRVAKEGAAAHASPTARKTITVSPRLVVRESG